MQRFRHNLLLSGIIGLIVIGFFLLFPNHLSLLGTLFCGVYAAWLILDVKAFNDILHAYDRHDIIVPPGVECFYVVERAFFTLVNLGLFVHIYQQAMASGNTVGGYCLIALTAILFVVIPILLWITYFLFRHYARQSVKSSPIIEVKTDHKVVSSSDDDQFNIYRFI